MNLANKITMSRLLLIPLFMLLATILPYRSYGMYVTAAVFVFAAATDKLDGYVARKYNQITKLGIFLDPLVDKLLITAALLFLLQIHKTDWFVALVIIGREIAITGFRLVAVRKGVILPADKLGKLKMVMQVVAVTLCLLDNYPFRLFMAFPIDTILMYLTAFITLYSGIHYLKHNWSVFREDQDYAANSYRG